jgi:hypothetical protein
LKLVSSCTKINSKCIEDINVRHETVNYQRETLQDRGIGKDFLNGTPMAQEILARIDKYDLSNFLNFCIAKEIVGQALVAHTSNPS